MDRRGSLTEQFMTDWTSKVFRERCLAQIDSARSRVHPNSKSEDKMEKFFADNNSQQLEDFVFNQSKCREDYVSLVAEMVMMLRQHAGKPAVDVSVFENAAPEVLEAAGITQNGLDRLNGDGSGGAGN